MPSYSSLTVQRSAQWYSKNINSYLLLKISLYSCVTGIPLGIQPWGPFRMFINSYFVLWSLKFLFSSDKGEVIAWKSLLLFLLLKCGYSNFLGLTSQHRPENPLAVSAATAAPTFHTCAQGAMTCYKGCVLQGDRHYRDQGQLCPHFMNPCISASTLGKLRTPLQLETVEYLVCFILDYKQASWEQSCYFSVLSVSPAGCRIFVPLINACGPSIFEGIFFYFRAKNLRLQFYSFW